MEKEFKSFEEIYGSNINEIREKNVSVKYRGLLIANLVLNVIVTVVFIIMASVMPYLLFFVSLEFIVAIPIIIISATLLNKPNSKALVITLSILLIFFNWISFILVQIYGYKLDF